MAAAIPPNNNLTLIALAIGGLWLFSRMRTAAGAQLYRPAGATPVYGPYLNQPSYGQQQALWQQQQQNGMYTQVGNAIGSLVNKFLAPTAPPPSAPVSPVNVPQVYTDATQYDDVNGMW